MVRAESLKVGEQFRAAQSSSRATRTKARRAGRVGPLPTIRTHSIDYQNPLGGRCVHKHCGQVTGNFLQYGASDVHCTQTPPGPSGKQRHNSQIEKHTSSSIEHHSVVNGRPHPHHLLLPYGSLWPPAL